jgi:fucose 4-O-acetylase-like acetyltransferase
MPLFFFLAGIFAKTGTIPLKELFKTKLRTRLLPVLFFTLLAIPLWVLSDSWEGTCSRFKSYIDGLPSLNWPTWFLVCLFSLEMLSGLAAHVFQITSVRRRAVALVISVIAGVIAIEFTAEITSALGLPTTFWFIGEALIASPFYLLGACFKKQAGESCRPRTEIGALLLGSLVLLGTFRLNFGSANNNAEVVMMVQGRHGNPFWFYLTACAGIATVLTFSRMINWDNAITRFVGSNTLIYLGFAGISMHFVDGIMLRDIESENWSTVHTMVTAMVYSILTMVFYAPTVFAIRRWLPSVVGLSR